MPHPFPRFLRKRVGKRSHCFLAGAIKPFRRPLRWHEQQIQDDADQFRFLWTETGQPFPLK